MITYTTRNGTVIGLMTPAGPALHIQHAEGRQLIPADLAEFADWLKRDPLRCYVAVDAFAAVAMQQMFGQAPTPPPDELPLKEAIDMVAAEQPEPGNQD